MPTLQESQQKWEQNTANAGERWKQGVQGASDEFCSGIAEFAGTGNCNQRLVTNWRNGVQRVTAQEFQNRISGKGDAWANGIRRAFGG